MNHLVRLGDGRMLSIGRLSIAVDGKNGYTIARVGNHHFYPRDEVDGLWRHLEAYADKHEHVIQAANVIIDTTKISEVKLTQMRDTFGGGLGELRLQIDQFQCVDMEAKQIWDALVKASEQEV